MLVVCARTSGWLDCALAENVDYGGAVSTNCCAELIWHGSYAAAWVHIMWNHHLINRESFRLFRLKTRPGG